MKGLYTAALVLLCLEGLCSARTARSEGDQDGPDRVGQAGNGGTPGTHGSATDYNNQQNEDLAGSDDLSRSTVWDMAVRGTEDESNGVARNNSRTNGTHHYVVAMPGMPGLPGMPGSPGRVILPETRSLAYMCLFRRTARLCNTSGLQGLRVGNGDNLYYYGRPEYIGIHERLTGRRNQSNTYQEGSSKNSSIVIPTTSGNNSTTTSTLPLTTERPVNYQENVTYVVASGYQNGKLPASEIQIPILSPGGNNNGIGIPLLTGPGSRQVHYQMVSLDFEADRDMLDPTFVFGQPGKPGQPGTPGSSGVSIDLPFLPHFGIGYLTRPTRVSTGESAAIVNRPSVYRPPPIPQAAPNQRQIGVPGSVYPGSVIPPRFFPPQGAQSSSVVYSGRPGSGMNSQASTGVEPVFPVGPPIGVPPVVGQPGVGVPGGVQPGIPAYPGFQPYPPAYNPYYPYYPGYPYGG